MEDKREENKKAYDRNAVMLTEADIDSQECYRNLSSEQKSRLIAFIYEICLALYNSYFENDE